MSHQPPNNEPWQQQPPPVPPKQSFWQRKVGCMPMWLLLGLIGLFVLISLINGITTGGKGIGNDSATPTTAGTVAPTPTNTPAPTDTPKPSPTQVQKSPSQAKVQQLIDDNPALELEIKSYNQAKGQLQVAQYFGYKVATPDKQAIYSFVEDDQKIFWTSNYHFRSVTVYIMHYRESGGADQLATATLNDTTAQTINWIFTSAEDAWNKYDQKWMSNLTQ